MRWKISWHPHAAGTDRGNPRDAGERHACQITIALKAVLRDQDGFLLYYRHFYETRVHCLRKMQKNFKTPLTKHEYMI